MKTFIAVFLVAIVACYIGASNHTAIAKVERKANKVVKVIQ